MPPHKTPITLADDGRDPWDRQPHENTTQWGYFEEYRKLGRGRDLKRTAEKVNRTHSYIAQLSSRYRWNERAQAYDRYDDIKWDAAVSQLRRRAAQEHLRLSREIYDRTLESVSALAGQPLTASEAVRMADAYSKLVRYALGEPDHNVGISGGAPAAGPVAYTHVPPDEAALRRELETAIGALARKHTETGEVDPYDVLDLPE